MRVHHGLSIAVMAMLACAPEASARVRIHINLASQTMNVESSRGSYSWPVSTARAGYVTPRGHFSATRLQRMHYSRKYDNSPMPHSIFFRGGYAIHGSYATSALGRPASHGCVRLAPGNAAVLYQLVQEEGASISITGSPRRALHYASGRSLYRARETYRPRQEPFFSPLFTLFGE
ncbi:L,D-transpeptidase [Methylocystis echinoides]|jgi:lipoprotein-anchoring transpeptidase ErfK/SrfK|uniref:L,D-transpeptidase n=1 Tax=Methylocystis echinoides TaxID=29468 RepID=UPI0034295A6A